MSVASFGDGKGTIELRGDNVVHLRWCPGLSIDEADARAATAAVSETCCGGRYPLLVEMGGTSSLSRGARTVFALPGPAARIALLGASPVDRVIVNYFIGRQMPPCPTRFITSADEALTWLKAPASQ